MLVIVQFFCVSVSIRRISARLVIVRSENSTVCLLDDYHYHHYYYYDELRLDHRLLQLVLNFLSNLFPQVFVTS